MPQIPEIPSYIAHEKIGSVQPYAMIDPSVINPLTRAQDELGRTAEKVVSDINARFKEAERHNLKMNEENAMMDYFYKLHDETANQPVEKRADYFRQKAQGYYDELSNRIEDRKTMDDLQTYWRGHTERGQIKFKDEHRKSIVSDGIAAVEEGNDIFSRNLFRMQSNPAEIDSTLIERLRAIDGLAEKGQITKADAQNRKDKLANTIRYNHGLNMLESDPYTALKTFTNPDWATELHNENRARLINSAQAEIKRRESEAKAEQRAALHEQRLAWQDYKFDIARMVDDYNRSGQKPVGWDDALTAARQNANVDKMTHKRMGYVENQQSELYDFKSMSLADMENDLKTQKNEKPGDLSLYEAKQKIFASAANAINSGDHLTYMEKTLNRPIQPLSDIKDEASLNSVTTMRRRDVELAKEQFGGNPNYLRDSEAQQYTNIFKSGSQNDKQRIVRVIGTLTRNDPDAMKSIMRQIHTKDASLTDEIGALLTGDNETAKLIGLGRERIATDKDRYGSLESLNKEIYKRIDDLSLLRLNQDDRLNAQFRDSIKNIYVGMATNTIDKVDNDLLDKAVKQYFGDIARINGYGVIPFERNMAASKTKEIWGLMNEELLKQAAGGELPMWRAGSNQPRAMDIKDVVARGTPVAIEEGKYAIAMPNSRFSLNKNDWGLLTTRSGKPFIFDYRLIKDKIDMEYYSRGRDDTNTGFIE